MLSSFDASKNHEPDETGSAPPSSIEVVTRRSHGGAIFDTYAIHHGDMAVVLHSELGFLDVDGHRVWLSRTELAVLEALASRPVVSRAELIHRAGLESMVPRRCEVAIYRLRLQLGKNAIRNVRKRGWQLCISIEIRGGTCA